MVRAIDRSSCEHIDRSGFGACKPGLDFPPGREII